MIPRRLLLLSLPVSLLLGACAHKPPQVVYVQAPAALPPTDSNKVRVADRVHAYSVGRLPTADGLAMNEAHQYYRIEDSAHWDQRLPDHPMQSSGPLGSFAPPTARRVAVSKEVHAAEAQNEALAQSMMQARATYRTAATQVQAQALTAEKNRVTADTYRTLLQTNQAENAQLRAENQRLRAAVDAPSTRPTAGATPGPRDGADPYERLKAWDQQSGPSPRPFAFPTHSAMTMELATPSSARVIDGALLDRLDGLQAYLEANIIGQPEVIPEVVKTIKNAELGFTEAGEPRSAFLFLGPTGVGKTEVTLQFTEYVCGPGKLIRLDMSEFMNLDAVGLLIGTPSDNPEVRRGLLGQYYDRTGGTGTLLFDEIEKAHRQVQDLFLQILDASRITLGSGETLDLSRMFLVATSNIGSQMLMHSRTRNRETIVRRVQTEAKGQMRPEIYARFNPVVVFNRLDFDAQRDIARVHLSKALRHMAGLGHRLVVDDSVLGPIIDRGYSEELGARPMRNAARAAVREAVREAVFARDTGHGTIRYDRSGQRFFLDGSSLPVVPPSAGQNRPTAFITEPLNA